MLKRYFKKGGSEIVSVVILIVILGGLAIGIAGGLSDNTRRNVQSSMKENNENLQTVYDEIKSQLSN